jgi:hypothetical protein
MIPLYSVPHGRNVIESILIGQCRVKQWFTILCQIYILWHQCWTKGNIRKDTYSLKKNLIRSKPKEVMFSGSVVWVGQKYSSHWYKVAKVAVLHATIVHSLLPPDCKARIWYCRWFQESVFNGLLDLELTCCSDKAWFISHGYVKSRNNSVGAQKILMLFM